MIKTVLLDIDGVLADFVEGTYRAFGKAYDSSKLSSNWNYYEEWGLTFEEFDAICTVDFWAGLRWMPDGREILKLVASYFDNIYLLTSPMRNSGSWLGKKLWVDRHLPQYSKKLIITEANKGLFATSETLLIDDRDKNCDDFWRAGGKAVLVPRPWNRFAKYSTETIRQGLELYK